MYGLFVKVTEFILKLPLAVGLKYRKYAPEMTMAETKITVTAIAGPLFISDLPQ